MKRSAPAEPPGVAVGATIDSAPEWLLGESLQRFLLPPADLFSEKGVYARAFCRELNAVRRVCRRWRQLAQSLENVLSSRVLALEFQSVKDFDAARGRWCDGDGDGVRQLSLVTGSSVLMGSGAVQRVHASLDVDALAAKPWGSLLSSFRNVVRLDLSLLDARLVERVLAAASAACPKVQALILPFRSESLGYDRDHVPSIREALKKWQSSNGGLKLFHVPWHPSDTEGRTLAAVTDFCPEIQYLRGWHMDSKLDAIFPLGDVAEPQWRRFCATCTRLRAWDWNCTNSDTSFVLHFAASTKPYLENLVADDNSFPYADYRHLSELQMLFPATPNLHSFSLSCVNMETIIVQEDTTADVLIEKLVRSCGRLKHVTYDVRCDYYDNAVVSGAGIQTLVSSRTVRDITLAPVRLEDFDLVQLLESTMHYRSGRRHIALSTVTSPHIAIVHLLERLAQEDSTEFSRSTKLCLVVSTLASTNSYAYADEPDKSAEDRLCNLVDALEARFVASTVAIDIRANRFTSRVGMPYWAQSACSLSSLTLRINWTCAYETSRPKRVIALDIVDSGDLRMG